MPDSRAPSTRDCPGCGARDGMKLQNPGVFSMHYICTRCGTALTLSPPRPEDIARNRVPTDPTSDND